MERLIAFIDNFTGEDVNCNCGCGKSNTANHFKIRVQALRYITKSRLKVQSWSRCWKHNKDEGGELTSVHLCEDKNLRPIENSAADLTPLDITCGQLYTAACTSGLFNEVIWYKKKNFVHCAVDPKQKANVFVIK